MFTSKVPPHTQKLLELLVPLVPPDTYLAGGTALCLHIDHRPSYDLDLYSPQKFNERELITLWQEKLPHFELSYTDTQTIGGKSLDSDVSIFYYQYPHLESPSQFKQLPIASLTDIGAMKVEAISGRGMKRDFYDLYMICRQTNTGLDHWLYQAKKKFNFTDTYLPHVIKSFTYFEDAETKPERAKIVDQEWNQVKDFFITQTKQLVKSKILNS